MYTHLRGAAWIVLLVCVRSNTSLVYPAIICRVAWRGVAPGLALSAAGLGCAVGCAAACSAGPGGQPGASLGLDARRLAACHKNRGRCGFPLVVDLDASGA